MAANRGRADRIKALRISNCSGKILLRLHISQHQELALMAVKECTSINQIITVAIADYLATLKKRSSRRQGEKQ